MVSASIYFNVNCPDPPPTRTTTTTTTAITMKTHLRYVELNPPNHQSLPLRFQDLLHRLLKIRIPPYVIQNDAGPLSGVRGGSGREPAILRRLSHSPPHSPNYLPPVTVPPYWLPQSPLNIPPLSPLLPTIQTMMCHLGSHFWQR